MAKIQRRVFRNDPGGTLGCSIMTVASIGIAAGIAYGFDAGIGGWACVGVGALLVVVLLGFHISNVLDRSPKLVIDAEGIHDLRKSPPVEYDWEDYKKVFVDVQEKGEGECASENVVALEVVDTSGDRDRITISAAGLDAKADVIAAAIEEVWEQIKARRGQDDPAAEEDEEKPKKEKPRKSKPWETDRAEDEDDEPDEDDRDREKKPRRWEW
jgi:hypothetical protein